MTPPSSRQRTAGWLLCAVGAAALVLSTRQAPSSDETTSLVVASLRSAASLLTKPRRPSEHSSTSQQSVHNSTDVRDIIVNVTKMTWASSNPVAARRFFMDYLPAQKAMDGCHPTCECGTQGRVELNGSFDCCQAMFGLHTVDSFTKPTGPMKITALESIYKEKLGNFTEYVDVMDHHVGMYTLDLDPWIESFVSDDIPFYAFRWYDVEGDEMTSLLFGVPDSPTVVIELTSSNGPAILNTTGLPKMARRFGSKLSQVRESIPIEAVHLPVTLWVSRATSNATRDLEFYKDVMGAEVTYSSDNAADGTFVRFVKLNTHPKVFEVHFVERRADDRGGYTVGDIEGYYKAVHAAKVHSPYCGFDTWFDNHIGVDMCNGMACPLVTEDSEQRKMFMDGVLRTIRAGSKDAPTYRIWKQQLMVSTHRWIYNVYVVEPSGQALQLNGFLEHADDGSVPRWNESLCGQGNCANINPDGPWRAMEFDMQY